MNRAEKFKVTLLMIIFLVLGAQNGNGAYNGREAKKNAASTGIGDQPTSETKSPLNEKIGRIEGRLDEMSRRQDAGIQTVTQTAQYAIDAARQQMNIVVLLLGLFVTLLTGGGATGAFYLYRFVKKSISDTVKKQEEEFATMKAKHEKDFAALGDRDDTFLRNLTAETNLFHGWMACEYTKTVPPESPVRRDTYEQALHYFKRGLEARPADSEIRTQILAWKAWTEKRLGRYREALESIREAVKVAPDNTSYIYNESCYAKISGDLDTAYRILEKVINLDPKYKEVAKIDPDWSDQKNSEKFKEMVS